MNETLAEVKARASAAVADRREEEDARRSAAIKAELDSEREEAERRAEERKRRADEAIAQVAAKEKRRLEEGQREHKARMAYSQRVIGFYRSIGINVSPGRSIRCLAPRAGAHAPSAYARWEPTCDVDLDSGNFACRLCGSRGGMFRAATIRGLDEQSAVKLLERFGFDDLAARHRRRLELEEYVDAWLRQADRNHPDFGEISSLSRSNITAAAAKVEQLEEQPSEPDPEPEEPTEAAVLAEAAIAAAEPAEPEVDFAAPQDPEPEPAKPKRPLGVSVDPDPPKNKWARPTPETRARQVKERRAVVAERMHELTDDELAEQFGVNRTTIVRDRQAIEKESESNG
jgi:hypothetical protein